MTAKHSPATSLPLVIVRNVRDTTRDAMRIDDASGMSVAHIDIRKGDYAVAQQFGRYIVHAANAYPKLVEALRLIVNDAHTGHSAVSQDASAILRELGEAE